MEINKFEVLKTASQYLVNLKLGIHKATEYFQVGEENKGCDLIIPITDGIQWISDVVRLTSDIQEEPISFNTMNEKLNEIVEALKNEDYILVGDLFEFEILPVIEILEEKINQAMANF
jgi:hypothetical protein